MKGLHMYHLKVSTLSPVHIGTGEMYEPTSFVIDDGNLYEFDEVLFYKNLSDLDKKALNNKIDDWMKIIDFYKTKKDAAKELSFFECKVSTEVQSKYDAKNPNQLQINRTYKSPNTNQAIIPGSSIKGMLDTVLGIYPPKSSNEERQKLVVSDALLLDGGVEIGYGYRKHRFKKEEGKGIPQMVEVIQPDSVFIMSIKTKLTFEALQSSLRRYHQSRENSLYQETPDSFIGRVGKYCGKEYMIDNNRNVRNSYGKPLATHSLYFSDNLKDAMFGWVKFERISEDSYRSTLEEMEEKEKHYFNQLKQKQAKILSKIDEKQQKRRDALKQKQIKEEAERKRIEEEQKEKEAKLAAMSPLERKIEELLEANPNKSETADVVIFNAIKKGKLDEYKCEALQLVKEEMQKLKKWVENTKKPEKDKKYKRTIEVIKMLEECRD